MVRSGLIDVVLATDMSKHFLHVNKFCSQHHLALETSPNTSGGVVVGEGAAVDTAVIKRMLIKCADVSNPARPRETCKIWAERIAEEYFAQVSSALSSSDLLSTDTHTD